MTMSPFEVERQEFGKAPMGYRRAEVDSFLGEVGATITALWQERADLREENERLNEAVARFTALEEQLKNTLLLAQDSAEKATEQARRESELLMREAGQKAREIVHQAHEERQRAEAALRELQSAKQKMLSELGSVAQMHEAQAQSIRSFVDNTDGDNADGDGTLRAVVRGTSTSQSRAASPARPAQQGRGGSGPSVIGRPPSFDPTTVAPRGSDAGAHAEESDATPVGAPS